METLEDCPEICKKLLEPGEAFEQALSSHSRGIALYIWRCARKKLMREISQMPYEDQKHVQMFFNKSINIIRNFSFKEVKQ